MSFKVTFSAITKYSIACIGLYRTKSSDYISQKLISTAFKNGNWTVLNSLENRIKHKIESLGTPLKNWDVRVNYGIKTGYNDAFIISAEKRLELVEKCPESDSIIRPILRGRDIKKYKADWAGLYIITTFPSLKINIDDYPAVKEHLLSYGYDRLKQTGAPGARKKAHNQWFETQDSINYWEDFNKPKLIYPDIMRMPGQKSLLKEYPYFYFDEENIFAEATNFIMTGENIDLIYLFLTSEIGFFAFSKFYTGPQFDATGFRYKKAYLDETFIPMPSEQQASALRNILKSKMQDPHVHDEINTIWAGIVGLEEKEVAFVNSYKKSLLSNVT